MHVVFGWHLDGISYPETVDGSRASVGDLICGPGGLLSELETHLGLGVPSVSETLRVAEYLAAITAIDDGMQFFSRSFREDPWSTARHLLLLRDELLLAGWNGRNIEGWSRGEALSRIEEAGKLSFGTADRIRLALDALERMKVSPFDSIQLITEQDSLPWAWRRSLSRLNSLGCRITHNSASAKARSGDLLKIQQLLLIPSAKYALKGDGSLLVLDADNELQAAEFVVGWLGNLKDGHNTVLIRGEGGEVLDQALSRYGMPKCGAGSISSQHSITQILPLAFELTARPLNALRAIEFLEISGGVIPRNLSYPLRKVLKDKPGIGSEEWHKAWQELADKLFDQLRESKDLPFEDAVAAAEEQVAEWKAWFYDSTFNTRDKLDPGTAIQICRRTERWASKRMSHGQSLLYKALSSQASTLELVISQLGDAGISQAQLKKIIDDIASNTTFASIDSAHASPWTPVDSPGQIWNTADNIIWWGFCSSQKWRTPVRPWSENEIQILRQNRVMIDNSSNILRRESHAWHAPILNAREKLIIIKPRLCAGETSIPHPVLDEINGVVEKSSLHHITIEAYKLSDAESFDVFGNEIACRAMAINNLPKSLREWTLEPGMITGREIESYSGLERLLGCPLSWVLDYHAKIRPSLTESIGSINQLTGNLVHAAVSQLFLESKRWEPEPAAQRVIQILEELLPQMASTLLLPGMGSQLKKAKYSIKNSVAQLVSILNQARLSVEGCEQKYQKSLCGSLFSGRVDMVVRNERGDNFVIDLKWTTGVRFHREKISSGKALQLSAYGWLLTDENIRPGGFFLLRQGLMLMSGDIGFPDYMTVRSDRSLQLTWNEAAQEYAQKLADLEQGRVIAAGIKTVEAAAEDTLVSAPCNFCNYKLLCGKKEIV